MLRLQRITAGNTLPFFATSPPASSRSSTRELHESSSPGTRGASGEKKSLRAPTNRRSIVHSCAPAPNQPFLNRPDDARPWAAEHRSPSPDRPRNTPDLSIDAECAAASGPKTPETSNRRSHDCWPYSLVRLWHDFAARQTAISQRTEDRRALPTRREVGRACPQRAAIRNTL